MAEFDGGCDSFLHVDSRLGGDALEAGHIDGSRRMCTGSGCWRSADAAADSRDGICRCDHRTQT